MKRLHLIFLFSLVSFNSFSQDKPIMADSSVVRHEFTLKDGTKLIGEIVNITNEVYQVKTSNFGTIKINNDQVVSLILLSEKPARSDPTYTFDNQFGHKYFIAPTAIPAERNKWYYTNQFLYFSNFTFGISKRLSAGLTFFTFVPTFFVSPSIKLTINPDAKTKFALRGQYVFVNGNNRNNLSFFQAIFTRGTSQNNFTLAIGKFVSDRGLNDVSLITVGVAKKISSTLSFISDNNFIIGTNTASTNGFGLLSGGLRFDRRMHSFDLGLYLPTSTLDTQVSLIPYIGFNLKLNK
jgi:hypothetical protein